VAPGPGSVLIHLPHSHRIVVLTSTQRIPVGSIIDARSGSVALASALDASGTPQTASFTKGIFQVTQERSGMTDIHLRGGSFTGCPSSDNQHGHLKLAVSARAYHGAKRIVRSLWASDHHGHYRTYGRNSVAVVRGTSWITTEHCNGTRTTVLKGAVSVRDRHRHRTVMVRPSRSYLARAAH